MPKEPRTLLPERETHIREVCQRALTAKEDYDQALTERRELLRSLKLEGWTNREIAPLAGISATRVSKVIDGNSPPRYSRRVQSWENCDG